LSTTPNAIVHLEHHHVARRAVEQPDAVAALIERYASM
jgi:hypothetical protein